MAPMLLKTQYCFSQKILIHHKTYQSQTTNNFILYECTEKQSPDTGHLQVYAIYYYISEAQFLYLGLQC